MLTKFATISLLLLSITACGSAIECKSGQAEDPNGDCKNDSWEFTPSTTLSDAQITDGAGGFWVHDVGYQWFVIDMTMHNKGKAELCLNWFEDGFELEIEGNTYIQRLQYTNVDNLLPLCYAPGQSKTGYIIFQIPKPSANKIVKLHFHSLTNIPIDHEYQMGPPKASTTN